MYVSVSADAAVAADARAATVTATRKRVTG
jgi:hypothetical protein